MSLLSFRLLFHYLLPFLLLLYIENEQKELKTEIDKLVNKVGNIVEEGVPTSKDEDADNKVVKLWGKIR